MKALKKITIIIIWIIIIWYLFYIFWFLRNPERLEINDNSKFISPANGKIVQILQRDQQEIPVTKKHHQAFKTFTDDVAQSGYVISIMMTPLNVHYQRASLSAKLIKQTSTPWNFLNAIKLNQLNNIIFENERNEMLRETDDWFTYKIIQIAWKLARRIVPMTNIWENKTQWDTIGLIKFWSQVTIILPYTNVDILVKTWDIVIDWKTIIANIK
jgi:phosphatidylserine decarboxylase